MIHIEGFEQFRGESALGLALARADYASAGDWALVAGRGSLATAAGISGVRTNVSRVHPFTGAQFSFGFAHYFTARGSLVTFTLGDDKYTLWLDPLNGLPRINGGQGGALPTITRWYYYEIEVDRANGAIRLYINNRLDSTYAATSSLGALTSATVSLGWRDPAQYRPLVNDAVPADEGPKAYDDFYIRDGARVGPLMVSTRFPTNDKHVEWFLSALDGSHSGTLSLQPPKPLDNFVASDTIGKEERFVSGQELSNTNPIIATGILVLARKSPSLDAKLGVFIGGQAGAPLRQDSRAVESEWRTQYVTFEQNPGDTVEGLRQADFGFKVLST